MVEEAPSPVLDVSTRLAMGNAAVAAAAAVDYSGAGTVEFLLGSDGSFYFLEMNTRLQVEHPVTECITGVDLVEQQIRVASGLPLSFTQEDLNIRGHAIEVRIYAEDPSQGFLPATGPLAVFRPPEGPGIRLDTGVREGDEARIDFDPMLAKLIVHGSDRDHAIRRMASALSEFVILGATTNIGFLYDVVSHPAYRAGETDTGFIQRHYPEDWDAPEPSDVLLLIAAAAEHLGIHRKSGDMAMVDDSGRTTPNDPFYRLNRRYP